MQSAIVLHNSVTLHVCNHFNETTPFMNKGKGGAAGGSLRKLVIEVIMRYW